MESVFASISQSSSDSYKEMSQRWQQTLGNTTVCNKAYPTIELKNFSDEYNFHLRVQVKPSPENPIMQVQTASELLSAHTAKSEQGFGEQGSGGRSPIAS